MASRKDGATKIVIEDPAELLQMGLDELKAFATDELGVDISTMSDRALIIQQILAQDEDMYKEERG